MKIVQKAYAKLNFNLHVLPTLLPNGYHQIRCLNFEADLADTITLTEIPKGIVLTCDKLNLAVDETNLAFQAAELFLKESHIGGVIKKGIKIELKKQIPITSGLGGGSTDAAAVILGLDKLWKLNLTDHQKFGLAKTLGMDVCYSIIGGICKITGAGEIVEPLHISFPGINLIVVSPKTQKPSTAWAYKLLDSASVGEHLKKLDKITAAIKKKDLASIASNLHNDFERVIFREFPEVAKIKAKMQGNGALGTILAGSGLSVFGIWENKKSAKTAFNKLKKIYPQKTFLTQTM